MRIVLFFFALVYQIVIKRILFLFDPEVIHNHVTDFGQMLGKRKLIKKIFTPIFVIDDPLLDQTVKGIHFINPVGLAAGFDYEGKLTQILPTLGFGFETVGTITNQAYNGNPGIKLGRLPKSKSLLVNKGFKNSGVKKIINKLLPLSFKIPIGISIGKTNTFSIKTQSQAITDIIQAFKKCAQSSLKNSYYELNISCPNLFGTISFYSSENLNDLLNTIDNLKLEKPLFIKMPIDKTNNEIVTMLNCISKHSVDGVIFGNLQKDRNNSSLDQEEVKKFKVGNFSGKPTFDRSNELIQLTYTRFKKRFIIIGCGGIFSAKDAYLKITLGATLVQLITGMIFEGPQLISQINLGLCDLLKKDGLTNISQAIGIKNNGINRI